MEIYGVLAEDFYRDQVPTQVTDAIGRTIIEQYGIAADIAEERWGADEMHDALPIFRRAEIETGLRRLRGMFAGQVGVEAVPNVLANAYHREIYAGSVVITQQKVEGPKQPIRDARFRSTLARRSQLSFDLFDDEYIPTADARLWACFIHMPSSRVDRPAFVRVAFPLPDGTFEHDVDLYDLDPDLRGYTDSDELVRLRAELRRRRTG